AGAIESGGDLRERLLPGDLPRLHDRPRRLARRSDFAEVVATPAERGAVVRQPAGVIASDGDLCESMIPDDRRGLGPALGRPVPELPRVVAPPAVGDPLGRETAGVLRA